MSNHPVKSAQHSSIETMLQGHQQQLASLKAQRAELTDNLAHVEKAISQTEGAIFGLGQAIAIIEKEGEAPAAPEPTPAPAEAVKARRNGTPAPVTAAQEE